VKGYHATKKIVLLPGDGIGPEIMREGKKMLDRLQHTFGYRFSFSEYPIGAASLRKYGKSILPEVIDACRNSDAVLLGPVGDPDFDQLPYEQQPVFALAALRKGVEAYCNIRSVRVGNVLPLSHTRNSTTVKDVDLMVVQVMRNGHYYHEIAHQNAHWETRPERSNFSKREIKRVAKKAFELAKMRRRKLIGVTDLSSSTSSMLWRSIVEEVAIEHSDVDFTFYDVRDTVDAIKTKPFDLDVLLCESRFAAIINNTTGKLAESDGMLASACFGSGVSIYQPIHYPEKRDHFTDYPTSLALLNSIALMLRFSFGMNLAAHNLEEAIVTVLARGDQYNQVPQPASKTVTITELVNNVLREVEKAVGIPLMTV
jgi:3-isopropylmalate dehydrogenase